MNKKGAIELSMTTIIIIVIGITILVLGLAWVRSTLGGVTELTEQALIGGEEQITEMLGSSKEPLNLFATNLEIEQGDATSIGVVVFNDQGDAAEYTLTTTIGTRNENDLDCYILDTEDLTDTFTLESGLKEGETVMIQDTGKTALGQYVCNIELTRNGEKVDDASIAIEIL
jgi:hypothetical protein